MSLLAIHGVKYVYMFAKRLHRLHRSYDDSEDDARTANSTRLNSVDDVVIPVQYVINMHKIT